MDSRWAPALPAPETNVATPSGARSESVTNQCAVGAVALSLASSCAAPGRDGLAPLEGDIGVIANGAGLGMGTMDAIRNAGGSAANFLDIGGGAQAELVKKSYDLVVSDPKVKALFINIFGGITRGDEVAKGILDVIRAHPPRVPLVVRLSGTEAEAGRKLLEQAPLESCETMDEAAAEAVRLAKETARA